MDITSWQRIQDALTEISGLPITLYDKEGNLLSSISGENKLIKAVMESQKGKDRFHNFFRESIKRAFEENEPLTLKTPLNQFVFIVPITLDSGEKVAIIGGYSFFTYRDFSDFTKEADLYDVSPNQLSVLAKEIKFSDSKAFSSISKFISITANSLLESQRSYQQSTKNLFKYKTLLEIFSDLSLSPMDKEGFQQVFHTLSLLFDVDSCSLMTVEGEGNFNTRWVYGRMKDELKSIKIDASKRIIREIIDSGKSLYLDDLHYILGLGFKEGVESVAIFPLLKNKETFALLNIINTPIDEEERELIQSLCRHLSLSTKSHRLKEELHKKNRDFTMLREVSKALSLIIDEEELYKIILDKSTELVGAKHGSLMLIDGEGEELAVKAIKGINEKLVEHLRIKVGEGISGRVMETSTPLLVKNIELDHRFKRQSRPRYETGSFLSIPLSVRSKSIGVLNISDKINGEVFSDEDLDLLLSFIFYATIAIERSQFYNISEELRKISITDPLTNLLNRRYFFERISEEIERSKRDGKPFTFMMIDIDNFKHFNDSRGHLAGDEALRRVSGAIIHTIRAIDVASRYGGEEFSVILPLTDKESSLIIAERLRQEVERIHFEKTEGVPEVNLSVSIGLSSYPLDAEDATELINYADKALYYAKENGKNRVVLFEKEKFLL